MRVAVSLAMRSLPRQHRSESIEHHAKPRNKLSTNLPISHQRLNCFERDTPTNARPPWLKVLWHKGLVLYCRCLRNTPKEHYHGGGRGCVPLRVGNIAHALKTDYGPLRIFQALRCLPVRCPPCLWRGETAESAVRCLEHSCSSCC